MQGNKKVLIAAVLLLLISVSFTTYAIYQSAVNVNTSVNAARWNVVFKKDSSTPIVESETITLTSADCPGNSHVAAGVIAPGATCTKTIILDAGNSQVDVTYTATAGPVTVGGDTVEGFTASLSPASGQILNGSETRTAELVLTVEWAATDSSTANPADTELQGDTISVPVTLTAKQYLGS